MRPRCTRPDRQDCIFLLDKMCGNCRYRDKCEIHDADAEERLVVHRKYLVAIIFAAPVSSINVIMYARDEY